MSWPIFWRRKSTLSYLLTPVSWLYLWASRQHQKRQLQRCEPLPVPVIVVGNIVVGGTGKTPFIHWLVMQLQAHGQRPAIVSRGYGGGLQQPTLLTPNHRADEVGDEPLLLAQMAGVPVCIGRQRVDAVKLLLQHHPEITVVLSDDGLQHLSLPRDLEICLFDGGVGAGNALVMPAGPLREPLSRLQTVPLVISKGRAAENLGLPASKSVRVMQLTLGAPRHLSTGAAVDPSTEVLHALCGIGQPESFFAALRAQGWQFTPLALRDHQALSGQQMTALAGKTVLMTSKDAIKLKHLPLPFEAYEVPLQVSFSADDERAIMDTVIDRIQRPQ